MLFGTCFSDKWESETATKSTGKCWIKYSKHLVNAWPSYQENKGSLKGSEMNRGKTSQQKAPASRLSVQ